MNWHWTIAVEAPASPQDGRAKAARVERWMVRLWRGALPLLVALLSTGLIVPASAAEKRLALVVGNARYPSAPLNNPENDAHVVASTLRRLGFEVNEQVNLGVKDFRRVLREYAKRVQESEGTALFFYAGHGVQIDGRNYLLPVDINVRDEYEIKDEAVDIEELFVSRLERARAQSRLVILDACRDNPFGGKTRGLRSVGTGLVEMGARGALIAYSSAPGATAEDGPPGTNSVFTRHMVKEMLVEGLEVEQMFKNVRVKVLRDTNQRQIPWVNSSMITNFSFNPRAAGEAPEAGRREDLARLQASLDKRERDQKELEEKIKRLSRELEQAQAASRPAGVPASAPAAPATAAREPTKPAATTTAPLAKASAPAASAPPAKPRDAVQAEAKNTRPEPSAPTTPTTAPAAATASQDAASARKRPAPAEVKIAQSPPTKPSAGHKAEGAASSERCVALLIRAQLGEPLAASDLSYLQKECK